MDLNEAGRRHRELREGRGWSLVDEEDRSGVHRNTINGFEMGKRKPRPSTLRKLAESLGVDVEDLTGTPKGEAPLFSDVPTRGPEERRIDYLVAPTDLIEAAESWLREEMAEGAGIEAVETVAWFHRLFLHRAAERYGLARVPRGLPAEEARALERLAVALDDLRSTVEEGYGTAINALMGRQAEIRPLSPNRRGRDEEEEETERETRSA